MKMLIFGFMMSIGWYIGKALLETTVQQIRNMVYDRRYKKARQLRYNR